MEWASFWRWVSRSSVVKGERGHLVEGNRIIIVVAEMQISSI